jgi:MarR family transcriptional regulator, 2-MHQ and catechol-resistance regulon repressor
MDTKNHNRENQTLVLALLRSTQLFHRAMGSVFRTANLTAPQWDVLETLNSKGALSINELMRLTLNTSGNIDIVIKNLVQANLIEKTVDRTDRRARVLNLTATGRKKVNDFMPAHNNALDQIFNKLSREEKHQTIKILNQLRKKLPQLQKDA